MAASCRRPPPIMSPRSSTASRRLGALIDNVLDLTQSDSGSLLLAEDEVDLAALCARGGGRRPRAPAARKGIDFAVEIEPAVGIVTGDPRRLGQALGNVLKNAVAYTDEGGRVLLRAEGDRDEARIIVSDNGRGIAPADQARVFDRFQPHRRGRARRGGGGRPRPAARQAVRRGAWRHDRAANPSRGRGRPSPSACRAPPASRRTCRRRRSRSVTDPACRCRGDRGVRPPRWRACSAPATSSLLFGALGAGKTTLGPRRAARARPSRARSPARPSRSS